MCGGGGVCVHIYELVYAFLCGKGEGMRKAREERENENIVDGWRRNHGAGSTANSGAG